jgi:lysine 2,3-aminomutase
LADEGWRHIDLWKDVSEEQWNDWHWQIKNRITKIDELKKIVKLTPEEEEATKRTSGRLLMSITPYWATLMDPKRADCPIRRQCVPTANEFQDTSFDMVDPLSEDKDSPVPGLVHRYPDRVLLLVTERCATYCRHCTRRRLVGSEDKLSAPHRIDQALDYIRSNRRIRDVLISGGDPLMLPDEKLEEIIKNVKSISHVHFLRIGTRMPVNLPMRITDDFLSMLKKYSPVWMSIHFNHPREITKRVKAACNALADNGVPLGSQTVLLRGINDRPYIMRRLMHELLKIRIRPYYIYQCDPVKGTAHFRTPIGVGINILERLRGYTSGYAVPSYVIDAPGGGGKIPISPNYIISQEKGVFTLRNYEGKIYKYHEPRQIPETTSLPSKNSKVA